jgi:hypothetical protein
VTAPFPPRAVDPPSTQQHPPSAGWLDDLYAFDPATRTWTLLSAALDAPRPSARYSHGFTSAGGKLYVHGGYGINYGDGCLRPPLPTSHVPVPTPCLPSPFASPAPPESSSARPRLLLLLLQPQPQPQPQPYG